MRGSRHFSGGDWQSALRIAHEEADGGYNDPSIECSIPLIKPFVHEGGGTIRDLRHGTTGDQLFF
jgi:hypothetical protein